MTIDEFKQEIIEYGDYPVDNKSFDRVAKSFVKVHLLVPCRLKGESLHDYYTEVANHLGLNLQLIDSVYVLEELCNTKYWEYPKESEEVYIHEEQRPRSFNIHSY